MINDNYCGVYLITSKATGRFYVGSAANMPFRKDRHLRALRAGRHHNLLLQALFNAHGEDDLEFSAVRVCANRAEAYRFEADEMERLAISPLLLNIGKHSQGGDNLTRHPNRLDVIQRTSETLRQNIENLDDAARREKYGRRGEANGMHGRTHSLEQKKKLAQAAKSNRHAAGRVMPEEQKARLAELAKQRTGSANGFYGRSHSTATREQISRTKRARGGPPPASSKGVSIDGTNYESIKQAMATLGLSRYTIKQRLADPAFPTYTEIV